MKIQKSRLTAIITVLVLVCTMVAVMVIPASATELFQGRLVNGVSLDDVALAVFRDAGCDSDYTPDDFRSTVTSTFMSDTINGFLLEDASIFLIDSAYIDSFQTAHNLFCGCDLFDMTDDRYFAYFNLDDECDYFAVSVDTSNMEGEGSVVSFEYTGSDSATPSPTTPSAPSTPAADSGLSKVVNKEMLTGVLNEVISLLPIIIPVIVGFIGLRKGISFLQSILHSA